MPDDSVFAADTTQIKAGGGATDEVGDHMRVVAETYADDTTWDPQDPPWGNDGYGRQFATNYIPVHTLFRDALISLGNAVYGAADLTLSAAKSFENAKDDALNNIHGAGGKVPGRIGRI